MDDPPTTLPERASLPPIIAGLGGARPAPILRRVIALALDVSLAGLAAWVILTRVVLPQDHLDGASIMAQQWQAMQTAMQLAQTSGGLPHFTYDEAARDVIMDTVTTVYLTLLVYFFVSELGMGGATLGKLAYGLRAARWTTGEPPSFFERFNRCLIKVTSLVMLFPFLFMANVIPVLLRGGGRAGHDFLAGTIVTGDAPPPKPEREVESESPWS